MKFVRKTGGGGGRCESDGDESNYEVGGGSQDDDDGQLPQECPICERAFIEPIVTKCRHYFCERCALQNYGTDANCFACGQATDGVFNAARDLIKHLKEKIGKEEENSERSLV